MFYIYDTYNWLVLLLNRILGRKKFGEINNELLVIDETLCLLKPTATYAIFLRKEYWRRVSFFVVINLLETIGDLHGSLLAQVMRGTCLVVYRWMMDMLFNQMLNAFVTLSTQAEALADILRDVDNEDDMRKVHKILVRIMGQSKRINKIFGLDLGMQVLGGSLFILNQLFLVVSEFENHSLGELFSTTALKWAVPLLVGGCYMFLAIHRLLAMKNSIEKCLDEFKRTSERVKISSNFYDLVKIGFNKNLTLSLRGYWAIHSMETIFTVSIYTSFNWTT